VTENPRGNPRWWQWPTILSIDAPAVSVLWLALIGASLDVAIGWPRFVVLGTSVWLAYSADRWIEGWRLPRTALRTPRHRFYQRHRWIVFALWVVTFAMDVALALARLPAEEIVTGLVLTAAVATYLVSHQLIHRDSRWRVPKEICIAGLLTCGVGVCLSDLASAAQTVAPLGLFAGLCFANCVLISGWEREIDRAHGQSSLALESPRVSALMSWTPWLVAAAAGLITVGASPSPLRLVAACATASAVGLAVVDRLERRIGWSLAHVLADVVLLTPAVALSWPR
jgi:hypothetical protein